MIFKLPCVWQMAGTLRIEADSLEEAKGIALEESPLPKRSDFIEGSFELDEEHSQFGEVIPEFPDRNKPTWAEELAAEAKVMTTSKGDALLIDRGPGDNPNAPEKSRLEIRSPLPDFKFMGKIRMGTELANFETGGMYEQQYHDTLESALEEVVVDYYRTMEYIEQRKNGTS